MHKKWNGAISITLYSSVNILVWFVSLNFRSSVSFLSLYHPSSLHFEIKMTFHELEDLSHEFFKKVNFLGHSKQLSRLRLSFTHHLQSVKQISRWKVKGWQLSFLFWFPITPVSRISMSSVWIQIGNLLWVYHCLVYLTQVLGQNFNVQSLAE